EVTPILHLNLPPFDSAPWDEDVNENFLIIDGTMAQVFGIANFNGIWKNGLQYTQGQTVLDSADSSMWMCGVTHTAMAAPTTFAQERAAQPTWWTQVGNSAADYAQAAADSAATATAANNSAMNASAAAQSASTSAAASADAAAAQVGGSVL